MLSSRAEEFVSSAGSLSVPFTVPMGAMTNPPSASPGPQQRRTTPLGGGAARQTYTVEEVARLLGISRTTAYECVRDGSLPALRLRRRVVVSRAALEAMLAAAQQPQAG